MLVHLNSYSLYVQRIVVQQKNECTRVCVFVRESVCVDAHVGVCLRARKRETRLRGATMFQ